MKNQASATVVLLLALALALALVPSLPQPVASAPIGRHVLSNGLEVLLLPESEREIASIQVWYRVGLPEEDAETAGFAHLLEHLMFTGTAANPDFRGAVAALGGRTSAGPREDLTYFIDDVPRTSIAAVIALEADRMRGLTLSLEAIQQSLVDVAREELAIANRWGQEELEGVARQAALAGSPYGKETRAVAASAATPERCRAFYDRFYGPDRACLVVAGGFEPDSVLSAITAHLGGLAPTGNQRRSPLPQEFELSGPEARKRTVEAPGLAVRWIALGYRGPGGDSPEAGAMRILESYLNLDAVDSLAAALRPRSDRISTSGIGARFHDFGIIGLLTVLAPLPGGTDADHALDQLAAAVARMTQSPIESEDFAILRDRTRLAQAASTPTVRDRGSALALASLRGGVLRTPAGADSTLAAVDPSQLAKLATAALRPEEPVRIQIVPAPTSATRRMEQSATGEAPGSDTSKSAPDRSASERDSE